MTEIFVGEKDNGQIQELISDMWLILCYAVQLAIHNVCTKFQNPKSSSFREIFDGKKKFTNRQTNIVTEKAKTIYPLYTSYAGGIINFHFLVPKSFQTKFWFRMAVKK